jgi:hypothetical protein
MPSADLCLVKGGRERLVAFGDELHRVLHFVLFDDPVCFTDEYHTLKRKIIELHWYDDVDRVADLECGHRQNVRHKPQWMNRTWVKIPEGRES